MAYLLDTDHLVILQRRTQPASENLTARLRREDPREIFISVISFHEQMQGWLALLNHVRSASQLVMAYPVAQRQLERRCREAHLRCPLLVSPETIPKSALGQTLRRKKDDHS